MSTTHMYLWDWAAWINELEAVLGIHLAQQFRMGDVR